MVIFPIAAVAWIIAWQRPWYACLAKDWKDPALELSPLSVAAITPGPAIAKEIRSDAAGTGIPSLSAMVAVTKATSSQTGATLGRSVVSEIFTGFPAVRSSCSATTAPLFLPIAFSDPASTAKALTDATKGLGFIKVKGGFMGSQALSAAQIKALAEMPPLPVVRAQLLGVLQAPAGKLVRTIAEPARGLAAVLKAFSEKATAAA